MSFKIPFNKYLPICILLLLPLKFFQNPSRSVLHNWESLHSTSRLSSLLPVVTSTSFSTVSHSMFKWRSNKASQVIRNVNLWPTDTSLKMERNGIEIIFKVFSFIDTSRGSADLGRESAARPAARITWSLHVLQDAREKLLPENLAL